MKRKQTGVAAVIFGETGFLNHNRPAGGEVTNAAVAEPAGVQAHVLILGDRELGFRAADVITVKPVIDTQLKRRLKTPTVTLKFCAGLLIFDIGGELKLFSRFFWGRNKANEFTRFAPKIFLTAPGDVFKPAGGPVRDRGEDRSAGRGSICFPKIGHHRLPRRQPFETARGNRKTFGADILAESEKRVVPAQIIDCRFYALVDLDLLNAGIALDVQNALVCQ